MRKLGEIWPRGGARGEAIQRLATHLAGQESTARRIKRYQDQLRRIEFIAEEWLNADQPSNPREIIEQIADLTER